MEITLPLMPSGITALLAFLSPYAIAIVSHPGWPAKYKRAVALGVTVVLAGLSMVLFYMMTGYVYPNPAQFFLLFLLISQAAYALILKPTAKALENTVGPRHRSDENVTYQG